MYKSVKIIVVALVFCLTSVFAAPNGELEGNQRGPISNEKPYNFGIPGYANIYIKKYSLDVMPADDERLYIEFEHEFKYGGQTYNGVTIYGNRRIFLGDHRLTNSSSLEGDGVYPYVKPIDNNIIPSVGNSHIDVAWRKFDDHNDVFTVIEIGSFQVAGQTDPLLCQVSFYEDGEIQVQYWNRSRSDAYKSMGSGSVYMKERDYMRTPYVYTGVQRVTLSDAANNSIYASGPIEIFNKGKLRDGWIAKGFSTDEAQFQIIDDEIDVDFGSKSLGSGGVIAYDFARENPVVGSFYGLMLKVYSVNFGDGNTSTSPTPVLFWYFQEHKSFNNNAHNANYPYFLNSSDFSFRYTSDVNENSVFYTPGDYPQRTTITPAAYKTTWDEYLKTSGVDPDTIIAPAIKMMTWGGGKNRRIRITYAAFKPLQPRSIQFFPPKAYSIKYEGNAGYMTVNGQKAPFFMVGNSKFEAVVHSGPGYILKQVFVNGHEAFNADNPNLTLEGISVVYDVNQKTAVVKANAVICNMTIKAVFEECSEQERNLPKVVPSYVKKEVFLDPADRTKILETYSVKDGFGRVVQTQVPINTGKFKVTALYLDEAGNTKYAPLPYVSSNKYSYEYEDMFCEKCVDKSRDYYNGDTQTSKERIDSYNHPYTETEHYYGLNSAITVKQAGMGEASFDLGEKFAQSWRIPLATSSSKEFFTKSQLENALTETINSNGNEIENVYKNKLATISGNDFDFEQNEFDYPYVLTINLSFDGVFTQKIHDAAGNLYAAWMTHDDEVLITRNVYDPKTTLLQKSYVENHNGFETSYTYDEVGRIIASVSPDRGRSETKYDSKNRIRFTRDARQIAKGKDYFDIFEYDDEDRLVLTGEIRGNCGDCSFDESADQNLESYIYPTTRTIYGLPDPDLMKNYDSKLDPKIVDDITSRIEGVMPYEAGAIVSYNQDGKVNTIKFSSYDNLDRVKNNWIVNLVEDQVPVVEFDYTYNSAGDVESEIIKDWDYSAGQWKFISGKSYSYDKFGLLESVSELMDENRSTSKKLVDYNRNDVNTLESVTYRDGNSKSDIVVTKSIENDIYGRTTKIDYVNSAGKSVYKENLTYADPLVNRVREKSRSWMLPSQNRTDSKEKFEYDDLGRLVNFTTDNEDVGNASYSYDIFGRLVSKFEKDTTLRYAYEDGSYRPISVFANDVELENALKFDESGSIWLDGYNKAAYKLNSKGLPERIALYGENLPSSLTLNDVNNGRVYDEECGNIKMAYDESGNRIWERKYTSGGLEWSVVNIPGLGVYKKEQLKPFKIDRLDLVGGGFRNGVGSEAVYPMKDAQGNVRAYISRSGVQSAYDYRPFGREELIEEGSAALTDDRRWQGKEFDGEHGKYYFGARYFDPFFGIWASPDPAGQYMNPYTFGGDPVNFVDPTGLWAFDAGIFTIGWDSNRGWNFGVSSGIFSYTWHQDGSKTFDVSISGSYQWYIFNFGGQLGYSYNTYSGHSLSAGGHVCVGLKEGEAGACAGLEAGGALNWDAYGNFLGATAYAGAFAQLQASDGTPIAKVNGGYEAGFLGMEGRSLYAGVSADKDGSSLYANWAENGGWSYGGTAVKLKYDTQSTDYVSLTVMGYSVTLAEQLSADLNYHKKDRALRIAAENGKYDEEGFFVISGHGTISTEGHGVIKDEYSNTNLYADDIAEIIQNNPNYTPGKSIKLVSCKNAVMAQELSLILKDTEVKGPSDNLVQWALGSYVKDGGSWNTYKNGKLVSSQRDGFWPNSVYDVKERIFGK
ncbi:MAG: RHS repeat-associated core domain-containing protein [Fibrobacter sp.]|nr:RHS repeat-associated core domain-containing protein [Fibrobacter sp.]